MIWKSGRNFKQQNSIPELYYFNTRHNKKDETRFEYEHVLLKKTTSPEMWKNSTMNFFLTGIEKLKVLLVESVSLIRNLFAPTVDKYYNDYLD
jgi:hypothetical protein